MWLATRHARVALLASTECTLEHTLAVVAGIRLGCGSLLVLLPTQLRTCSSKPFSSSVYCFSSSELRMTLPLSLVRTTLRIESRASLRLKSTFLNLKKMLARSTLTLQSKQSTNEGEGATPGITCSSARTAAATWIAHLEPHRATR